MSILVTGASGWIGSHVRKLLADRDVCLLNWEMDPELSPGKLWMEFVRSTRWDACIHLARKGGSDYSYGTCYTNAIATRDLFEALRDAGCGLIVNAGSCFELGEQRGCVDESALCINPNPLGLEKLQGLARLRRLGVPYRHARPFYIWGPGQRETSLIPSIIAAYEAGREPDVRTPDMAIDLLHVEDCAKGFVALLDADCESGVYNLASGQPRGVDVVVDAIAERFGQEYPLAPLTHGFYGNVGKTYAATGWRPSEPFEP